MIPCKLFLVMTMVSFVDDVMLFDVNQEKSSDPKLVVQVRRTMRGILRRAT